MLFTLSGIFLVLNENMSITIISKGIIIISQSLTLPNIVRAIKIGKAIPPSPITLERL
jgi:hypothetical protein